MRPIKVLLSVVMLAVIAGAAATLALSQGMMGSGGMREMMRGMMQGEVPPPGMTPETLPAPKSDGARLLAGYCTQRHDLPSPRYKTAAEWPAVLERMTWRMRMMSGGMMGMHSMRALTSEEERTLSAYLRQYAMMPAQPKELDAGPASERWVFASQCARCHALPSPALHPPEMWSGIVARMQANMQLMGKTQLTAPQQEAVVRFLQAASRAVRN